MRKKGVSPVISGVLLISLVITMAVAIMIWSTGITEKITGGSITLQGKNIALTCSDIVFEFSYTEGKLYLINPGNIPIYGMKLRIYSDGSFETQDIKDLTPNWPEDGLKEGKAFSDSITFDANVNKVVLIPVLMGSTNNGEKREYICENTSYDLLVG